MWQEKPFPLGRQFDDPGRGKGQFCLYVAYHARREEGGTVKPTMINSLHQKRTIWQGVSEHLHTFRACSFTAELQPTI